MKILSTFRFLTATLAIAGALNSCSSDSDPYVPPTPVTEVQLTSNATLGSILTDKDGRTLYYFANDDSTVNHCTGGCEALWPVFNVDNLAAENLGTGLTLGDFSQITTSTSAKQLAYKGRPLYYYAPVNNGTNTPEPAGAIGGDNFNGIWFAAKPDYTIQLTNAQLIGHDGKHYKSDYTEGDGKTLYFTDGNGVTLYTFINDRYDDNNFTADDFANNGIWPVYEEDVVVVPSSLDKNLFNTITVAGTHKQLTYKGWPLYYFGQDAGKMGSNKGISFPAPGVWPVPVKDMAEATP
ncbi:COG4315 family predicted lipoprotein [Flavihumibacter petaseus]|nr:hypothetical protein [Flavihumibacter petaseus]